MNFRFWNMLALVRTADELLRATTSTSTFPARWCSRRIRRIEQEFVWTLRNVGVDHVLMGSDYPQIGLGKTVDAFKRLGLTAEETTKILSGNARKLFGR